MSQSSEELGGIQTTKNYNYMHQDTSVCTALEVKEQAGISYNVLQFCLSTDITNSENMENTLSRCCDHQSQTEFEK